MITWVAVIQQTLKLEETFLCTVLIPGVPPNLCVGVYTELMFRMTFVRYKFKVRDEVLSLTK